MRFLGLILSAFLLSPPALAQWGGQANIVNMANPQVLPPAGSPGLPAVDDNLAAGNYGLSTGICAEWGHQVPCTNHYSITRASIKYCQTSDGVLFQVASSIGCLTNQGWSIEEARTNLRLNSQTFNGAQSTNQGTTSTDNAAVAPDGTSTAAAFAPTATNANHNQFATGVTASVAAYTNSVYAKANAGRWLGLSFGITGTIGDGAYFDLVNGAIGTVAALTTATMTPLANGWYRLTITRTLTSATRYNQIEPHSADGEAVSWNSDGSQTFFLWGAQMELGAFPTSYIPTTTTSATRAADSVTASLTGALGVALSGATGSALAAFNSAGASVGSPRIYDINSSVAFVAPDLALPSVMDFSRNSGTNNAQTANTYTALSNAKVGVSWMPTNDNSIVLNNGVVATSSAGTPGSLGGLAPWIGNRSALDRALNGSMDRVSAWGAKLPDPTLKGTTQ